MYWSTCRPSGDRHVGYGSIVVSIASTDRHSIAGVISTHDPLVLHLRVSIFPFEDVVRLKHEIQYLSKSNIIPDDRRQIQDQYK